MLELIAAGSDGGALERLMVTIFTAIPGVSLSDQDRLSTSGNEELDLAFVNAGEPGGLTHFGSDLLSECKSQRTRVDAQAVNWFATKMRRRHQSFGVLVALAGITGNSDHHLRAARAEVEISAIEGQQILVVTGRELAELQSGEHFANLLSFKRSRLTNQWAADADHDARGDGVAQACPGGTGVGSLAPSSRDKPSRTGC
jgi:hypothetical protein